MKRILLIMLAVLCVAGCSKEKMMQGKYTASTTVGTINLELLAGGNCIGGFSGEEEKTGTYEIKGDEIRLSIGGMTKGKFGARDYHSCSFMWSEPGTIHDKNKFSVLMEDFWGDDKIYCSFVRR